MMAFLLMLLPFVQGADDIDSTGLPQFLDKPLLSTIPLTLLASTGSSKRDLHIDLLQDVTFSKFMDGKVVFFKKPMISIFIYLMIFIRWSFLLKPPQILSL